MRPRWTRGWGYVARPAAQALPFQNISPALPEVEPCTYWPTVQAVLGFATTLVAPAALAGGVEPEGVQVPGMPAVAPVAAPAPWSATATGAHTASGRSSASTGNHCTTRSEDQSQSLKGPSPHAGFS